MPRVGGNGGAKGVSMAVDYIMMEHRNGVGREKVV